MKSIKDYIIQEKLVLKKKQAHDDTHAIDLELPSGTLWCDHNVGAREPEEYGDYVSWGETEIKSWYKWDGYKLYDNSSKSLKKYNGDDNKTVLEPKDDYATLKMGDDWYTPTIEQCKELLQHTTQRYVYNFNGNNTPGFIFKSKYNDKEIFFPASGIYEGASLMEYDKYAYFWTSTVFSKNLTSANILSLHHDGSCFTTHEGRYYGMPIRAVKDQ
jgi:hypothetical protein